MTNHRRSWRRRMSALCAVLLPAAIGLAACSGNSSSPGGRMPTVTIGKAVDTIGFSAIDVAQAMGYFKDAGVNVDTKLLRGSSQTTAALQSGGIQFATLSSTALLLAATKGVQLQAICSLDHGVSVQIVVENAWAKAHRMDPQQPLPQRMAGLEGAKDAAISSTGTSVLQLMMQQNGADAGTVKFVTVGSDAAGAAALGHGTLQVFVGSPPSSYYMARKAGSTIIAKASEVPSMKDMAYDVLITNPSYASSHSKIATAVATALARAENLMAKDPQKVLAMEAKHFSAYSQDDILKSLQAVQWTPNGMFTQSMWDDAKKVSRQMGQLQGDVSATEGGLWTNKYLDTSSMNGSK